MDAEKRKAWPELYCEDCKLEKEFIKFDIPKVDDGYWWEVHQCPRCKDIVKLKVDVTTTI